MMVDQPSPADLYAEWRAFDLARERRVEAIAEISAVEEPAEEEAQASTAVAAPEEPVDRRRPCPCCQCSGREPEGVTESPRTGRRYAERTTASGVRYGMEPGGRFVMVEAGGHVIEKGRGGRPSLDRLVDELADKLRKRAAAVERAKGMLTLPRHREALDDLLAHWFRHPTEWPSARKRILATVKRLDLNGWKATAVGAALCSPECRSTWDE